MKKVRLIWAFMIAASATMAQEIDPNRMNRDLKIAEDIISTIFKNEAGSGHFLAVSPKATYVPGFGVMINVNSSGHFYSEKFGKNFNFTWEDGIAPVVIDVDELKEIEMEAERLALEAQELAKMHEMKGEVDEERMREIQEHAKEMKEKAREKEEKLRESVDQRVSKQVMVIKDDADREAFKKETKELYRKVMTNYLTDYADLIGQLGNDEKVMLTSEIGGSGHGFVFGKDFSSKVSAAAMKKDISSYRSGKLTRDKFIDTIVFTDEAGAKKSPDLELLSSIFQRMYKVDLATTYYCNASIPYEQLESFGAIFKMKVYSSTSYGKDNHKITTLGKSGLTQKERDEIVDSMYPQFLSELKANILDYGKTVKSLNENEQLIFQVNLTQCIGCQMPKQIDVSIPISVLLLYDSGKIKREDALKKFNVKEGR